MDHAGATKIHEQPAAPVVERSKVGGPARALLAEGATTRAYLDALDAKGLHEDGLKVLARALSKREAIWLGCLVAAGALGPEPKPDEARAIEAAKAWVAEPNDRNRRAAFAASQAAGMGSPAGCVAASVFFSGGSISAPKQPDVPPPEHTTGDLVSVALTLAALVGEPGKVAERRAAAFRVGIEVAEGKRPWPKGGAEPAQNPAPSRERPGDHAHAPARRPAY